MAGPKWWQQFPVTSWFGDPNLLGGLRTRPAQHVDLETPEGLDLTPVEAGTIISKGSDPRLGNYVTIRGKSGDWLYFHGSNVPVEVGQQVDETTPFFRTGNTGASTGPHTSIRLIRGGQAVDPAQRLGLKPGGGQMSMNYGGPKPSVLKGTLGGLKLLSGQGQISGQGQTPPAEGGFTGPPIGGDVWGDLGAFFSSLVGSDPVGAVRRAMAQGGAPMYGGPAYLQDIAGQIASYTLLQSLLNLGTGKFGQGMDIPGSFGELLGGGSAGRALNPQSIMSLVRGLMSAGTAGTPEEQVAAAAGTPGTALTEEQAAQAGGLGAALKQFEAEGGPGIQNITGFTLKNPQLASALLGMMGFGSGLDKILQSYFQNVISPAYGDFEDVASQGAPNALTLMLQLLGMAPQGSGIIGGGSVGGSKSRPPVGGSGSQPQGYYNV